MRLRWSEVRDDTLMLRDSKTGPRTAWLSSPARRDLDSLERTGRWVFPASSTDRPASKGWLDRFWWRLRAEAGLDDVRLHDLRHSYASRALALGEGIPVISKLLGHRRFATTARYAHLAREGERRSAAMVGDSIGGDILAGDGGAAA